LLDREVESIDTNLFGGLPIAIAYGGDDYAMVDAEAIGLCPSLDNDGKIIGAAPEPARIWLYCSLKATSEKKKCAVSKVSRAPALTASREVNGQLLVTPRVRGRAFVTVFHPFILVEYDSFPKGFRVGPLPLR
jgi:proline racemase